MSLHEVKVWAERTKKIQGTLDRAIKRDTEQARDFVTSMKLVASAHVTKANYVRANKYLWMDDPYVAMQRMDEVRHHFAVAAHCNNAARRFKLRAEGKQLELI